MNQATIQMPWGLIDYRWKDEWRNAWGKVICYEYLWEGKWIEGKNYSAKARITAIAKENDAKSEVNI